MNSWKNKYKINSIQTNLIKLKNNILHNPAEYFKKNELLDNIKTPLLPLYKNICIIDDVQFDINLLQQDVLQIIKHPWINKNKENSWQSITLKSKDGNDQNYLEKTKLGIGNDNIYTYTKYMVLYPYIKKILDEFNTDIYLVRLLKLNKKGIIKFHTDEIVFEQKNDIIRCHLPIITDPNIRFKIGYPLNKPASGFSIWNALSIYEQHLTLGKLWYTNVNCLHAVDNFSNIDRIHLVIDLRPTEEIKKIIYT
jgi:hypothetical protein